MAKKIKKKLTAEQLERKKEKTRVAIVEAIARGEQPPDIARRLHPDDKKKMKAARQRIWRMLRQDALLQKAIVERGQAHLMLGVIPATVGLQNRSSRKTDAAKLVLEATGVHNPRVKHEHSGEVNIKLDLPRPKFVDATVANDGNEVEEGHPAQ